MKGGTGRPWRRAAGIGALAGVALAVGLAMERGPASSGGEGPVPGPPEAGPAPAREAPAVGGQEPQRWTKAGISVEFSYRRAGASGDEPTAVFEGDRAELRFRITDASTGQPLRGLAPAAWLDPGGALPGDANGLACQDKVPLYLKGHVGIRPLVDLNSYFLLVLNADPTITVIDPLVGMPGKTSLLATILLRGPGADWVPSADGRRLFVSIPKAGRVAVIDTETFRVTRELEAGTRPTRLALQADGRYLWAADGGAGTAGGVAVIDTESLKTVATLRTGAGHHEVAFGPGDRYAFVTNRDAGTVTAIDVARLAKVADLPTGPVPISIARSPLSERIYVADGRTGEVAVIDPERLEVVARIAARPGLGPLRFTPDGRYGLVVNPTEGVVHVVDASANRLVHEIALPGQPYELAITERYAYVRLLDSEHVQMIRLASLGAAGAPTVQSFAAGTKAPRLVPELSLAGSIVPAVKGAGVFVVAPADGSTYGYMEGMNAPAGSFQNYGHSPRAVRVVDRSLRETAPGLYSGLAVPPVAGNYDVALLLDTPRTVHCFGLAARERPGHVPDGPPLAVEWAEAERALAGRSVSIRFRLDDPGTRGPRGGLSDVRLAFHASAGPRAEVPAREVEVGLYEADVRFPRAGAYYLHVAAPSAGVRFGELPFRAMRVDAAPAPSAAP